MTLHRMMSARPALFADRLRAFMLVCGELALILLVVQRFALEAQKHFFPVLCLAAGGFLIHAWLPRGLRAGFFTLLSLGGILFVLGWPNGAWVLGIGGGLIALCHLPVPLVFRVLLLAAAAVQLASWRVQVPAPFWPVLGSMFMFRLIVYLYENRQAPGRPPLGHTLAYFFPLPNVCFPLFPVLDFKTFRETYYNADDYAIYQTGVVWIVRGISHLLLYRFIKYYLLPAPYELRDGAHLVLFLVTNYALYLRVSGWFHVITGLLHLFGFNLPRTHHNYFLAASFSDIWRRINIYWKDFMMNVFFFPTFFALRRWGTGLALAGAALGVFLATWGLHSYQMFWLVGELPLRANDAILWLTVGVLVAGNLQLDLRRARQAGLSPAEKRGWQLGAALSRSLRTVGMFLLVSFFWACWTIPGFVSYLPAPAGLDGRAAAGILGLLAVVGAAVAAGVLAQLARDRLVRQGLLPLPVSFNRSVAVHGLTLGLLLLVGTPRVAGLFGPSAAELAAVLRQEASTPGEAGQLVRSYYEEIAETHVQAGALLGALSRRDEPPLADSVHYSAMTRPTGDLRERELIPGWSGKLAGSPLTVNQFGMRDREDITLPKPAHTCRIALVGTSVVMGYGVADDQVFKGLLEARLNAAAPPGGPRYELLNFGTGMSTVIHRRALIDQKVFAFAPDALYYFAHQDELLGAPRHLAKLLAGGQELPYPCLTEAARKAGITPGMAWGAMEMRLQRFGREIVGGLYRDLVADCRHRGILPVWIYLPMPGIVEVSVKSSAVVSLAAEAGFVVVNLAGWSDGYAPAEVKLSATDHHPNALGHRVIAERLFAALRQRPELLPAFARLKP